MAFPRQIQLAALLGICATSSSGATEELHYEMRCYPSPPGAALSITCTRYYALAIAGAFRSLEAAKGKAENVQKRLDHRGYLEASEYSDFRAWRVDERGRLLESDGRLHEPRSAEAHIWGHSRKARSEDVTNYARYVSDKTWMCGQ